MKSYIDRGIAFFSLISTSSLVFAADAAGASFDSSAAVAALGGIATAVAAIGAAKLAPAAISVGWKWLKGAIFG
ncbi:hypothetical protein C5H23_08705 [Xylella fastidiosa]|uniref:major capsid protein n=1 Tax=Xylella fastidiosa TaxID=2371 RepID=UPI0011233403|nr:major capsid protein [Xylella fastidiosa]MDD0930092.1 major capsid protein [Xylella fastidiosa subsp. multiplex]QTX28855.1 hypothetical protein KBP49_05210 [Xylella fastidiosa subsp. multiplex]TNV88767.1 hypothetical protein C5H23_08705 [Xylella fastidiosa]UIT42173.1 major capsid protein [Xylella fastidiosa subsp. multiplex]